jgi:hypothetical protein
VDSNVIMRGDKSFADDLNVQRSIVSSRVALLLRSAEIKLLLSDLCVTHTLQMFLLAGAGWCLEIFLNLFIISYSRFQVALAIESSSWGHSVIGAWICGLGV